MILLPLLQFLCFIVSVGYGQRILMYGSYLFRLRQ